MGVCEGKGGGVVADAGGEDPERAVDRRVGIAADDDLSGFPEAALDDGVMDAAAAAVEDVFDAVLRGEFADGGERFSGGLCGRGEVVIEGEDNAGGVGDAGVLHFVFEDFHDEVGAEIVHHHEVDVGDDDVAGADLFVAARLGEDFLDDVHSSSGPSGPRRYVSPLCAKMAPGVSADSTAVLIRIRAGEEFCVRGDRGARDFDPVAAVFHRDRG